MLLYPGACYGAYPKLFSEKKHLHRFYSLLIKLRCVTKPRRRNKTVRTRLAVSLLAFLAKLWMKP